MIQMKLCIRPLLQQQHFRCLSDLGGSLLFLFTNFCFLLYIFGNLNGICLGMLTILECQLFLFMDTTQLKNAIATFTPLKETNFLILIFILFFFLSESMQFSVTGSEYKSLCQLIFQFKPCFQSLVLFTVKVIIPLTLYL